jgi:hypothetical protein
MSTAYIIEIGEEAAGIVAAEARGFRFYAATAAYFALEGIVFATPRHAEMAARAHRRKRAGRTSPSTRPH